MYKYFIRDEFLQVLQNHQYSMLIVKTIFKAKSSATGPERMFIGVT